jgi:hypothetical protein
MRLWSIHPKYLDPQGLVALWREGLLAKKVLEGETRGYRNHPQLTRFKNSEDPILAINSYLFFVYLEAEERGYNFDINKINPRSIVYKAISVERGQAQLELDHLLNKLAKRNQEYYRVVLPLKEKPSEIALNPLFYVD